MMVAKEWNDKKAKTPEQLESPLRTLLLQSMLQELLNRVQKESSTEEGRARLVQKGWLTPEHHWAYLRWDRSGQAAHPGHQAAHPACGPHPNTYVDAARAPRRDHPNLQISATDAQDRSAGPPGHHLQTRSVTPGPNLAGDARGIRQAGCVLRDAFDRSLHQAGQPAPVPTGSTACRPDLPPSKPQAPPETQIRVGSPPTPPTCLRFDADADAPPSVAPLIGPGFLGGRNQCYMNAPLYGVLYAAQLTGQLHRMPTSLRDRTGPAQWAERLLGFRTPGMVSPSPSA